MTRMQIVALISLLFILGIFLVISLLQPFGNMTFNKGTWQSSFYAPGISTTISIEQSEKDSAYRPLPNFYFAPSNIADSIPNNQVLSEGLEAVNSYFLNNADDTPYSVSIKNSSENSELVNYGNALGDIIKPLSESSKESLPAFGVFISSPSSENATPLKSLSKDMMETANKINGLENVPESFSIYNKELSDKYAALSGTLNNLSDSESSDVALDKVAQYNSSVESLGATYVRIAKLFALLDVQFKDGSSGSIFSLIGQ